MYSYDANTGGFAKLGDCVEVVRSGIEYDGMTGRIGGWGDPDMFIALVALDKQLPDGRTIVGWPIVCLRKVLTETEMAIIRGRKFLDVFESLTEDDYEGDYKPTQKVFGNLCSESVAIDTDGFIVWEGGADRPVHDDTLIQVRLRDGTVREQRDARYWYQAHWRHWPEDHPMNKWDIVAYKVTK
jgi:hypothetical protein